MTGHTPGPWAVDSRWNVSAQDGEIQICFLYATAPEPLQSNARLIAAAPETADERDGLKAANAALLSMLQDVREYLDQRAKVEVHYGDETGPTPNEEMDLLAEVDEAIAKAKEGGS